MYTSSHGNNELRDFSEDIRGLQLTFSQVYAALKTDSDHYHRPQIFSNPS